MAITIFLIYIRIVIDKVLVTRIIRWIDVNDINLSCMSITKGGKGFEVITLDKDMVGSGRVIANSDFSSFVRPSCSFIFFASSYLFISDGNGSCAILSLLAPKANKCFSLIV